MARLFKSAAAEWSDWRLAFVEHVRVLAMVGRELVDCGSEDYRKLTAVAAWEYPILEVPPRGAPRLNPNGRYRPPVGHRCCGESEERLWESVQ